jgi:uncharacterized integral membrane protein
MSFVRRFLNFLVIIFVMGYGGYFGFLNMERVYVHVPLFGEYRIPSFLAFLITFLLGALFAAVFFGYDFFKKSFELRRTRKAVHRGHKEAQMRVSRFLEQDAPPNRSKEHGI